jgi:hypothetical protein
MCKKDSSSWEGGGGQFGCVAGLSLQYIAGSFVSIPRPAPNEMKIRPNAV